MFLKHQECLEYTHQKLQIPKKIRPGLRQHTYDINSTHPSSNKRVRRFFELAKRKSPSAQIKVVKHQSTTLIKKDCDLNGLVKHLGRKKYFLLNLFWCGNILFLELFCMIPLMKIYIFYWILLKISFLTRINTITLSCNVDSVKYSFFS